MSTEHSSKRDFRAIHVACGLSALLLFAFKPASEVLAADLLANNATAQSTTKQESSMVNVAFGEHSKATVLRADRDRIRQFYQDVLGCPITKTSEAADVFQIGPNFYLGAVYGDSALSADDMRKSLWLELRTDHLEQMKERIVKFGIKPLEYWDKAHFYFQAPGGQVYRLIDSKGDMTNFQRQAPNN